MVLSLFKMLMQSYCPVTVSQSCRIFSHSTSFYSLTKFLEFPVSASPKTIVSSPSWKVDLSGTDEYVKGDSQMKSSDADTFSLEDPDLAELKNFKN